jgi:hypothetical protein
MSQRYNKVFKLSIKNETYLKKETEVAKRRLVGVG